MAEFITLEQLKKYDNLKGQTIEGVEDLPSTAENHFYAKKHSYNIDREETKTPIDLVGSYFRLVSNGKYTIRDMYKVVIDEKEVKSIFISNFVVSLYANADFSGLYADTLNSQTQYNWTITESVEHYDIYAGKKDTNEFIQLANYEQVDDFFIRKTEKGSAGGVATLDADGRIPIEQMNIKSMRLIGTYDCSSGVFPSTDNRLPGDYYRVSVGGTLTEMRNDIVIKANESISSFEAELINKAIKEGLKVYIDVEGVKNEIVSVNTHIIILADTEITLPTNTDTRLYADVEFPFSWSFDVGDFILFNENNEWQKLKSQDSVTSVNGKSGDVVLYGDSIYIEENSNTSIKEYIDDIDVAAVIESSELPSEIKDKVYNVSGKVYSKDIELITKAGLENFGFVTEKNMYDFMSNTNEFTFVPDGYSDAIYLNYRTKGGLNGNISQYLMGDGAGGLADIKVKSIIIGSTRISENNGVLYIG